jgi:hypothetical protein
MLELEVVFVLLSDESVEAPTELVERSRVFVKL